MPLTTQDAALVPGAAAPGQAAPSAPPMQAVRCINGFRLPGREIDPAPGDEFEVPRPLALELAMYHKVELIEAIGSAPAPAPAAPKAAAAKAAGKEGTQS